MPIYAYRCSNIDCQHSQDFLRKMSDPPLLVCNVCLQNTFVKQLTSAGFALKGMGWYATDFREKSNQSEKNTQKEAVSQAPLTTVPNTVVSNSSPVITP
ncbi:MAG: regulatory protein FmdB family [Pseudomonadota bacterium]|jgi:putative FmdB family regulatory protein